MSKNLILSLWVFCVVIVSFAARGMEWHPSLRQKTKNRMEEAIKNKGLKGTEKIEALKKMQAAHLKRIEGNRERYKNLSDEKKDAILANNRQNFRKKMADPISREAINADLRRRYSNRTDEERERKNEYQRQRNAQKAKHDGQILKRALEAAFETKMPAYEPSRKRRRLIESEESSSQEGSSFSEEE